MSAWLDLTHALHPGIPYPGYFPPPSVERVLELTETTPQVTRFAFCTHMGTHIDAPRHFVAGGATLDEIPLQRLAGDTVVWRLEAAENEPIGVERLEAGRPRLHPGDALFLVTGWDARYEGEGYGAHPYLDEDAARWIVEQEVRVLAIDFQTPDLPVQIRREGFEFPVHRILLGDGVLVVENLAAAGGLAGRRVESIIAPLPLRAADGAPVRILAREKP